MSDFTDSLRSEDDDQVKTFILELFDRVNELHEDSKTEIEKAYHQGEKDALRRVLAVITGFDVDRIIPSSIIAYKLRGDIPLDDGTILENYALAQERIKNTD